MRAPLIAALLLSSALAAGCTDNRAPRATGADGVNGATSLPDASAFDWTDDPANDRVQTGTLEVPFDYDDPAKGTFTLFVARHLAEPSQRIGSMLVNPGGPGFGGSTFAISADQVYSDTLLQHFDIIGWDPRGTGLSEPAIDCTDDYDHFYASSDLTPETAAERQYLVDLAEEFAGACLAAHADIIEHVGTNNTARDMDAIRQALGEDRISYFGFSYGSELGATWATLFPHTVRAAVLDGAVDPTAGLVEISLQQMEGFEEALAMFLADCSADPDCAFHNDGDAEGAFDRLMDSLDESPIPSDRGRPDVNLQVAVTAASEAMYSDRLWPQLAGALADAQQGEGSGLLALHDMYFQRAADGSYSNGLEAFQVIFCMDHAERLTVAEDDATVDDMLEVAPRLAPSTKGSYFCTFFPPSTDPRATITGDGAGPILVMGTTGDSATPLSSTRAMADALEDGRLVIVTGNQHTGYNVSDCSQRTVDDYLVDPVANAPADGAECR
ncbi:MAG: alpha/beta hydrolase [Actinomycetota bacterium]|nr:alpha/beta hydrolase [Actinomycetota bacterium]